MKKTDFNKFMKPFTTDRGYTATILRAETPHKLCKYAYQVTISDVPKYKDFVFIKHDEAEAIKAAKMWHFR